MASRDQISRRAFLGTVGAGAAGALTSRSDAIAAFIDPRTATSQSEVAATQFGRIFQQPPFADPNSAQVRAALTELGKPGGLLDANDALERGPIELITNPELSLNNRDNEFHTAGTTFVGQFLDHDLTFDVTSPLGVPTAPEQTPNTRTAALDLDSLYGRGPSADPVFYDPNDRAKLNLGFGGQFEDLPRDGSGVAVIPDPRNDENLMIAGLHAAFILFHNRAVDRVRAQGVPSFRVFSEARRLVLWHYHWIVLHEFLPQIIGGPLVDHIVHFGRRFYRPPQGGQFIPVEFQTGTYRFGHTMVRPSYRANLKGDVNGAPFFGFIFDPAGQGQADPVDLRGGARAPRRFIGWQTFFDFRDGEIKRNKRIDTRISTPLFRLPLGAIPSGDPPTSLPVRNLLRHMTWSLPSGQRLAQVMGEPSLGPLPELRQFGQGLDASSPLWFYALKEAEAIRDGISLGPVAGRIVGEVFVGIMQLDPGSYLSSNPGWRPTFPSQTSGDFRMTDLLRFARVDPASRGQ